MRIVVLFLLLCFAASTQTFEFDKLTKYTANFDSYKGEKTVFSNSRNGNCYMSLKNQGENTIAILSDLKTLKVHYFEVSASGKSSGNQKLEFRYFGSDSIDYLKKVSEIFWSIDLLSEDDASKTFRLSYYKNAKKQKVKSAMTLNVRKDENSQFALFRQSCLHLSEDLAEFDFPIGGIVTSAQVEGKNKGEHKLTLEENVNLAIPLPSKQYKVPTKTLSIR